MRYDEQTIEQVRASNDIVDVIGQHVRLTKKGANYFGLCPFHGEKTASFSVSPRKQIYYCFGCGAGGNVISFMMQYESFTFTEALKSLAERAHITLPEGSDSEQDKGHRELKASILSINKDAALFYHGILRTPEGSIGYDYFSNKRRLSNKTITHFGLGFSPKAPDALYKHLKENGYSDDVINASGLVNFNEKGVRDKFWNRVIFPIMDTNNRVIGFGGRVMGDGMPKYLNSPETVVFDKSATLYGLNFAKKSNRKFLLLCEGYMDVIALHQAGFTNAVASLGTAFNEKHARLLKRYTDNVILTQDSDTAGTNAKLRAFPILHEAGLNVRILEIEGAKDPDELIKTKGPEAYEECISKAKNAFIFMIDVLKRNYDLSDPAEKTDFYNAVADRLCMFKEPLERANYTDSVSTEFMIDRDELKRMVEKRFELKGQAASGVIMSREPITIRHHSVKKRAEASAALKYEILLVSWLCERPELADFVFKYISEDTIETPVLKDIVREIIDKHSIDEARFLSKYQADEEALKLAAEVFSENDKTGVLETLSQSDLEKGLTEAVRAIKSAAIDRTLKSENTSLAEAGRLLKEKNELVKLHVEINNETL
ncbi:MAG: DNA primase [Lachnospiraceae bacterium]|nr:DNA primase [Lachnospiraceae bacterium]